VFAVSRAAIWIVAASAHALLAQVPRHPLWAAGVQRDLGAPLDIWSRWDGGYFLKIAEHGYASAGGAAVFYPLYPSLVGILGRLFGGHFIVAGVVISLTAAAVAVVLFYELGCRLVGERAALRGVVFLCVFPTSLFLQAVYSESLLLALMLAALLLAMDDRWTLAAVVTGLALLTRPTGFALIPALAVIAARRREARPALAGLGIAAGMFALFPIVLAIQIHKPLGFLDESIWHRHLSRIGPFGGIWDGARAAFAGAEQLLVGHRIYWDVPSITDLDPHYVAAQNLEGFAYLVLFLVLTVLVWRRLGAVLGVFATASLIIPLSEPSRPWPLLSLQRFGLVVFPFFLVLGTIERRSMRIGLLAVSAALLALSAVQWGTWRWVA
jgi:hypothetical protein